MICAGDGFKIETVLTLLACLQLRSGTHLLHANDMFQALGDTSSNFLPKNKLTRRRMAQERRGAGSSLVSMGTPY